MELGQELLFSMKWNQNWNDSKSENHTTRSETLVVGDNHGPAFVTTALEFSALILKMWVMITDQHCTYTNELSTHV
jgi:hypothetical protein